MFLHTLCEKAFGRMAMGLPTLIHLPVFVSCEGLQRGPKTEGSVAANHVCKALENPCI